MALHHAQSGELIDIRPASEELPESRSVALFKTDALEVMRLAFPPGHSIPEHCVAGEITFQCLKGKIALSAHGKTVTLEPGYLLYLEPNVGYALHALKKSSLLMTVLVEHE